MGKLQDILSNAVQKVGSIVEGVTKAAAGSKTTRPKKTGVMDETGQDFGAIQWEEKNIHTLLAGSERKEILPLLPTLAGKKTLHLTPARENYIEIMNRRGAQDIIELDVSKTSATSQGPKTPTHIIARGSVDHLPFAPESFDFILYPSALAWRSDLPSLVAEVARCLKENGRVLISTVHPFFEYLMNPRGGFKKNIDTMFETMKKNGFFVEELKEGTLEEALRNVSLPQKMMQELQRYPGLPLVLVFKAIRLRKKQGL